MPRGWVHFYKGYQLSRGLDSKAFFYGNERLPAHVTNYDMAEKFIDAYLEPKMIELGIFKKNDSLNPLEWELHSSFPLEHCQAMRDEIEKNWFYYKTKTPKDQLIRLKERLGEQLADIKKHYGSSGNWGTCSRCYREVLKLIDAIEKGTDRNLKVWNCGWHTEEEIKRILSND